ncbi:MAG: ATPase component of various ABC-type transport system, containing duplicated ATPase [Microbacterium sp.]|jgi:peptide/nickel transport system ATP-binding protein|uniref:dipeptide ABC transporter ATP-binding protein n=1 Tax=Microbacterium sp. TaxID=51671 RepID=UPI0026352B30|nr:ABC transporter ATP-binding protein [Microbacterium sp.]MDF2560259.1 ATPase component of various ABC-type transport system, containing duplicated ATPase [Microbacterium sp.]
MTVLEVRNLRVGIGQNPIVHGIDFAVDAGQTLGIVGESGSGKSMTVLAATGLLDAPARRIDGSSLLRTEDGGPVQLVGASDRTLRSVHGGSIGFVFQDPSTSLNPYLTVGRQISESLETHRHLTRRVAHTRAIELLDAVGIPDPAQRVDAYAHQFSGGQRQRVMIAIALACDPALLIADEPTTALDVTTQAQIIELVKALQQGRGTAVIWISHDLGVIGQVADDVLVLRKGETVEHRPLDELYTEPAHTYTRELLAARPRIVAGAGATAPADAEPLLEVAGLDVTFAVTTPAGSRTIHAVDDVSFRVERGTTLALVGESGSGKSTIANVLTGLVRPRGGTATLSDAGGARDVLSAPRRERRRIAMVFQDPFSSIDPRRTIGDAIAEPLRVHRRGMTRSARADRVKELLRLVDLDMAFAARYPHELSGGQRQRASIARALALEPELLILDEATASLDVSVQARVLALLRQLQEQRRLTYLFIAHDLAIVQQMAHDVVVLRGGQIVEAAPAHQLFAAPRADYTQRLLAAVPQEAMGIGT